MTKKIKEDVTAVNTVELSEMERVEKATEEINMILEKYGVQIHTRTQFIPSIVPIKNKEDGEQ